MSLLVCLLCGLCASAHANTTAPAATGSADAAPARPPIRMGLLLPLDSPALSEAAEAVRAGFLAAHNRDGQGVNIRIFRSGAQAMDVLQAYADAAIEYEIVIGPLSRDDLAAVVQHGRISTPTVALAQLAGNSDGEAVFPEKLLMMGYSIEDEARKIAHWASAGRKTGSAYVISTDSPWQKRAAKAFSEEWQLRGLTVQMIELPAIEGYFVLSTLTQLKLRMQAEKPTLAFLALDAQQTDQLRSTVGSETLMYGTSQINTHSLSDLPPNPPPAEMNGLRALDIPWLLQPDHLAVMSYPPMSIKENQKRRTDMERLYALGIDAYRVAKEIANQKTRFTMDGVTGALTVNFGNGTTNFKRIEQQAIYRQGHWIPFQSNK